MAQYSFPNQDSINIQTLLANLTTVDTAVDTINSNTTNVPTILTNVNTIDSVVDGIAAKNIIYYGSAVKSVQRGVITIPTDGYENPTYSASASISSVNTSKTKLSMLGFRCIDDNLPKACPTLVLTNSTTVTAERNTTGNAVYVSYEVIEFY